MIHEFLSSYLSKFNLKVQKKQGNLHVVTTTKFPANYPIYQAKDFLVFEQPTYQTVQVGENFHVLDVVFAHMNHSCEPTTFIECNSLTIYTLKDLDIEEEVNFFYPSNEWQMDKPFQCLCGSSNCIGTISGAYNLSLNTLNKYPLNAHIARMLNQPYFALLYP
ncbi:hypothetical protein BLD44_020385 [Mastigocladus laminosus UU774]|nr:hypothetical protein BLD44_020385 [Mastigocladus laminosus UU774]